MEDLPMKKKEGFFAKIKKFWVSLFNKKIETNENKIENNSEEIKENVQDNKPSFKERVQEDVGELENKSNIIEEIEKNPDLIYSLSKEKLKELIKLYDEEIAKVDQEIQELKKQTDNA